MTHQEFLNKYRGLGLSQEKIAESLNVSTRTIRRLKDYDPIPLVYEYAINWLELQVKNENV